jgi:site-specific recombinase XerD
LHPSNVNRELTKVLKLAGLDPSQTFHNLRHGAATYLLEAGVGPRVVMELMGWSQMSMLQRYQAVRSGMIDDAAAKLAAVFPARPSLAHAQRRCALFLASVVHSVVHFWAPWHEKGRLAGRHFEFKMTGCRTRTRT